LSRIRCWTQDFVPAGSTHVLRARPTLAAKR
jgi:hypothetical protein